MPSLGMKGPYAFNHAQINLTVRHKGPGNFALGYLKENQFIVRYLGRSDTNLVKELLSWCGNYGNKYSAFKFSPASTAKQAYETQVRLFKEFGGTKYLENSEVPEPPRYK